MALAEFITSHMEDILKDWEQFAATLNTDPDSADSKTLRDFAREMLNAVAADMRTAQTGAERLEKSRGHDEDASGELDSAARRHAADRRASEFTQKQLIAEFRALRSSVVSRWREEIDHVEFADLDELTRFNEAMDQLLTESIDQYEGQLRQAREQLEDAHSREQHLRNQSRQKDHFLSMLAHELRNPLAPIVNAAQILRMDQDQLSERSRQAVAVLGRQSQHMARLVDDLLDTARISSGRIQLRREHIDLAGIVQECAENIRPRLDASGIPFSVTLPDQRLIAEVDRVRIAQVLNNLLDNAAKFSDSTAEGAGISLSLLRDGPEAILRVTDSGIGIAPRELPRLFELFEQGEVNLDRSGGGLGLGLHLVKRLAQLHGGSVTAHSAGASRGSRFDVRLPLSIDHHMDDSPPESTRTTRTRRVLLVEDNPDAAEALQMLLEALGHVVRIVNHGGRSIAAAEAFQPDIALLDLGLPEVDGFEVARLLRDSFGHAIKLIAVTGYSEEAYREASLKAGFDAHLVKPVSLEALQVAIGEAGR